MSNRPVAGATYSGPFACEKCGRLHPKGCRGHSKKDGGRPCTLAPMRGQTVCGSHGGRSPQARAAAARRTEEAKARNALAGMTIKPVTNPLLKLAEIAGEMDGLKTLLRGKVDELNSLEVTTREGAEQVRAVLGAYERALDRTGRVLVDMARLNLEERLAKLSERDGERMWRLFALVFGDLGIEAGDVRVQQVLAARVAEVFGGVVPKVIEGVSNAP